MNITSIYTPHKQKEHKIMIDYLQCKVSTWNLSNYHFKGQDSNALVRVNSKHKNGDSFRKYGLDSSNKKVYDIINLAKAYNLHIVHTFFEKKAITHGYHLMQNSVNYKSTTYSQQNHQTPLLRTALPMR